MIKKVYLFCLNHVGEQKDSVKLRKDAELYLIKRALFLEYDIKREDIEFKYGEKGKPYFRDLELYFNISHSGNYIACVLDNHEIGIDIQKVKPIKNAVMEKYLWSGETEALDQTIRWTEYESYGKKLGCGIPMQSDEYKQGYFLYDFSVAGYVITVCTDNEVYDKLIIELYDEQRNIV